MPETNFYFCKFSSDKVYSFPSIFQISIYCLLVKCFFFYSLGMPTKKFRDGAVGVETALHCGFGATKILRFLAAPALQHRYCCISSRWSILKYGVTYCMRIAAPIFLFSWHNGAVAFF
jgi:hypothetical protein